MESQVVERVLDAYTMSKSSDQPLYPQSLVRKNLIFMRSKILQRNVRKIIEIVYSISVN